VWAVKGSCCGVTIDCYTNVVLSALKGVAGSVTGVANSRITSAFSHAGGSVSIDSSAVKACQVTE